MTPRCDFLVEAGLPAEERQFNSPCLFQSASHNYISQVRQGLRAQQGEVIKAKAMIDKKIKTLLVLEKRAQEKPVLPRYRPDEWFKAGDKIVCFIGNLPERIVPQHFASAVITGNRGYGDSHILCCDERVHSGKALDGRAVYFSTCRPDVMRDWEFEYLLEHPDFAQFWSSEVSTGTLGDNWSQNDFLAALAEESANRPLK
jgi:hypothetical protein